jgi:hypothetical protein
MGRNANSNIDYYRSEAKKFAVTFCFKLNSDLANRTRNSLINSLSDTDSPHEKEKSVEDGNVENI